MDEAEAIYKMIGEKLRTVRERSAQKLSQAKLAKQLGISRASIVNIEGGRQHASLHLLWRIACALDTDLAMIIPKRAELLESEPPVELDEATRQQIKVEANGDTKLEATLTAALTKMIGTLRNTGTSTKRDEK